MKTALLVIDAQRIYTNPDSEMYCEQANETLANINLLIRKFEKEDLPIVFIRHVHKQDGSDLGRMFDYAGPAEDFNFKENSDEVKYDEALVKPDSLVEITKNRYSAFVGTKLAELLNRQNINRVAICGFMTNFCCDSTARDAHDLDFFVDFITDATGTPGTEHMNQAEIRKTISELLAAGFTEVFSSGDYVKESRRFKIAAL